MTTEKIIKTLLSIRESAETIYNEQIGDAELNLQGSNIQCAYYIREWTDELLAALGKRDE